MRQTVVLSDVAAHPVPGVEALAGEQPRQHADVRARPRFDAETLLEVLREHGCALRAGLDKHLQVQVLLGRTLFRRDAEPLGAVDNTRCVRRVMKQTLFSHHVENVGAQDEVTLRTFSERRR